MRSQLSRYSPLSTATCLVLLAACGEETARASQASERSGALASAALTAEAEAISETNSGTNSGWNTANPAATSEPPSTRPVVQRRASPTAQVTQVPRQVPPAPGQVPSTPTQVPPAPSDTIDVQSGDETGPDEPQVSRRESRLAWLADDSFGENLPAPTARTGGGGSVPRLVLPLEPPKFVKPDAVKGIYVNAWAAGSAARSQALIDLAARTEVNTFVIDLKDASGYVSYATEVMTAREAGADQEIRIRDLVGLLERLQEAGIYPIARIVMVKDPLLIRARPEWAVQDTAGGVWVDSNGLIWANLHDQRVWDYHVDLPKEAAAVGFPEIQWDYVRFADAPQGSRPSRLPGCRRAPSQRRRRGVSGVRPGRTGGFRRRHDLGRVRGYHVRPK